MKSYLVAAALALCAACGPSPAEPPPVAQSQAAAPVIASYVGLWAASPDLCTNPPWRIEERSISTRGEVHCDFNEVRERPGGYEVDATCYAEAPPAPYTLQLRLVETPRTLSITGGPWPADTRLVACGPLPPA